MLFISVLWWSPVVAGRLSYSLCRSSPVTTGSREAGRLLYSLCRSSPVTADIKEAGRLLYSLCLSYGDSEVKTVAADDDQDLGEEGGLDLLIMLHHPLPPFSLL
ncbi:hypothetical protein J5N97_011886 [Dioscorea zingiberensis]|uniref:Uncharacterized protein n=1 Tax=Dioscorea zingiberensis TaxID=325984 RepID=A0A9D5D1B7_9LILI|nr:hypothetical protein J5N97_011886 [Dioscorea zingiberensis]